MTESYVGGDFCDLRVKGMTEGHHIVGWFFWFFVC